MNKSLFDLQHEFFTLVNSCDSFKFAMNGVNNLGISYTPVRDAPTCDIERVASFAKCAPVPVLWIDLARVTDTYRQLMLPVQPPFYHALKREIFMLNPQYFSTDKHCLHALLHETAHHIHFNDYGYNTSKSHQLPSGRLWKYPNKQEAYNIGEMVAETSAAIAAQVLGILSTDEMLGCAEYVSMYRLGGMVATKLPAEEAIYILPIAERLINLYRTRSKYRTNV